MSDSGSGSALEARGTEAEVTLLEVEPGVAVLFGETVPPGWEVEPFGLGARADGQIVDALSMAVGLGNLVAPAAQGMASAQGLVRLAPETLRQLRIMQPIVKDGYNLGVLTQGGKFSAIVRYTPATGAQAATILASLGPSLTLLAISAQLTAISLKVDQNIALTREVLEALHKDHWDRLSGLYRTIAGAIEEAHEVGTVTPRIYARVEGLEASLAAERETFTGYVDKHVTALKAEYAERREYLRTNAELIVADVQGLIMVETAYCRYQMLRAAEIAAAEHRSVGDDKLMERLARQVPIERREAMERIAEILRQLDAQCHLADETTGSAWKARHFLSRNSRDIDQVVSGMAAHVAALRGSFYDEPLGLHPAIELVEDKTREKALSILRWALPADVPLLALAEVTQRRLGGAQCYLGITPTHFFITTRTSLTRDGGIDEMIPLEDVRYVRYRSEKKGAALDVITKDENLAVTVADAAPDSPEGEAARRVADLLMAAANLPEEEGRSATEFQGVTSRRDLLPAGEATTDGALADAPERQRTRRMLNGGSAR